jgi:hypothetical protein
MSFDLEEVRGELVLQKTLIQGKEVVVEVMKEFIVEKY